MPPIIVACAPHCQFYIPRSFVLRWDVFWNQPFTTIEGRHAVGFADGGWRTDIYLKEKCWLWSSNTYSVDHIVESATYQNSILGISGDLEIECIWQPPDADNPPRWQINQAGFTPYQFTSMLPQPPSDYWLWKGGLPQFWQY